VSINVLEDVAGVERLANAGIRGLPVVSRGHEFIYGVDLSRVAELVGQAYDAIPALSADVLVARYQRVLDAALRFARQIPINNLNDRLPHRDRSFLTLVNHLVQIADDYLEIAAGADFAGRLAASLPEPNLAVAALESRSLELRRRLAHWLDHAHEADLQRTVTTYFGDQTLHQVLERCVWHSAQHARQLMMVLEGLDIDADQPLQLADLSGLPMPKNVWDG
jgi:hypothetical protein